MRRACALGLAAVGVALSVAAQQTKTVWPANPERKKAVTVTFSAAGVPGIARRAKERERLEQLVAGEMSKALRRFAPWMRQRAGGVELRVDLVKTQTKQKNEATGADELVGSLTLQFSVPGKTAHPATLADPEAYDDMKGSHFLVKLEGALLHEVRSVALHAQGYVYEKLLYPSFPVTKRFLIEKRGAGLAFGTDLHSERLQTDRSLTRYRIELEEENIDVGKLVIKPRKSLLRSKYRKQYQGSQRCALDPDVKVEDQLTIEMLTKHFMKDASGQAIKGPVYFVSGETEGATKKGEREVLCDLVEVYLHAYSSTLKASASDAAEAQEKAAGNNPSIEAP